MSLNFQNSGEKNSIINVTSASKTKIADDTCNIVRWQKMATLPDKVTHAKAKARKSKIVI